MHASRITLITLLLVALPIASAFAGPADQAAKLFADGQTLLAKGEFAPALKAYEAAAEAYPDELNYDIRASILRRVIAMRGSVDKLEGGPKWSPVMRALYGYYMENEIYAEGLVAAEKLHAADPSVESALLVARAQLAMNDNAAAAKTLRAVRAEELTPSGYALLGIALARQGEIADARTAANAVKPPEKPDAGLLYDLACLHALVGDADGALKALTGCFENTPPSRLATIKDHARGDADLAGLKNASGYTSVLTTASKVAESSCSSGTDCGKCPSRASCAPGDEKKSTEKESGEKK